MMAGASSWLSAVLVAVETSTFSSLTRSRSSSSESPGAALAGGSSARAAGAALAHQSATTAAGTNRFLMAGAPSRGACQLRRGRVVDVDLEQSVLVAVPGEVQHRRVPGGL